MCWGLRPRVAAAGVFLQGREMLSWAERPRDWGVDVREELLSGQMYGRQSEFRA